MDLWIKIAIIAGAIYLLLCLAAYLLQDFFLFHPEKLNRDFKFNYNSPFEEICIAGSGNSMISALLFHVKKPKGVVFYFKGNTRSIKGWAKFAKDFTEKGYDFFLIDYPGFGKSTGKRCELLIYKNAQIAYLWLKDLYQEDDIIIYGRSLGAGFATCIASWNNPKLLILDSPFYSFLELARYYTRILPTKLILKYCIPLYRFMKKVRCQSYILHGNKDRMIPYRFSLKIEKINSNRIRLLTIHGAHHNDLPKHQEYHWWLDYILNEADTMKRKS